MVLINNLTIDEINAALLHLQRSRNEVVGGEKGTTINKITVNNSGGGTSLDYGSAITDLQKKVKENTEDITDLEEKHRVETEKNREQDESIEDLYSIVQALGGNGVVDLSFDETDRTLYLRCENGTTLQTVIPSETVTLTFDSSTNKLTFTMGSQTKEVTFPYINANEKGASNGVATLDATGRVPYTQLPESAMELLGDWDASTNTPHLQDGTGTNGDFYICNVPGTVNFGTVSEPREITFYVNDRVIYLGNGNIWQRLPASEVRTVNGQSGDVELSANDIPYDGNTSVKTQIDNNAVQSDWSQSDNTKLDYIKNKPSLAAVATSGSYNDLSNKPTIPAAQIQSDWNVSDTTSKAFIKNKPTIPAAQVNSDWNATSGKAQILNKPSLANVATSGSYNDLLNKPTIPQAPVQSNWTENNSSSLAFIKNKPSLATVATSGNYNDLSNKPTIPDAQVQSDWTETDSTKKSFIKNKIPIWITDGSADDNMSPVDVVQSGNTRPVTSGGVANALALPTDAVLHYSFDEVPDYPDGTAIEKHIKDFTSVPSGWDTNNKGVLSVSNGELVNTLTNGTNAWFRRYFSSGAISGIIKIKIRATIDCQIIIQYYDSSYKNIVVQSVSANQDYVISAYIPSTQFVLIQGYVATATSFQVYLSEIYIGDGSYSTPIIDNANGEWNSISQSGVAVSGVSGKGLKQFSNQITRSGFNLNDNFTVSLWINPENNTGAKYGDIISKSNQFILRNGQSDYNALLVWLYGEPTTLLNQQSIGSLLTPNVWTHVVIVRDGTTLKVYRNGNRTQNLTLTDSTLRKNDNTLRIGNSGNTRPQSYDDLLIFDRALSEQEVQALYLNKGNTPKYYPPLNIPASKIPQPPSTDGSYTLHVTVANGKPTYSWS